MADLRSWRGAGEGSMKRVLRGGTGRWACQSVLSVGLVSWLAAWATVISFPSSASGESYLGPDSLVVSPDHQTLYVACLDSQEVLFVTLPAGTIARRVSVPAAPTGIVVAPNGNTLYVTCAAAPSVVVVLDVASAMRLATIPVGHTATDLALDLRANRLFVCNRFDNDLSVVDLSTFREVARIGAVREPIAVAMTPDCRTVLVANHLPNVQANTGLTGSVSAMVTVVDTQTLETAGIALHSGASGLRDICVSPDGRYAIVTHVLSNFLDIPFRVDTGWINVNVVSIIDLRRREVLRTIGLDEMDQGAGNPWSVAFTPDGQTVCVSCAGTHELGMIASADLLGDLAWRTMAPIPGAWPVYPSLGESLWRRESLPGKGPRGMTIAGSTVYVSEYFSDQVSVLNLDHGEKNDARVIALGSAPSLSLERQGQLLFNDATICYQHWQSCASCHPDGRADSLNWDLMNDGTGNPKNTKSMLLAHETPPSMAEGVRATAEKAVRAGLTHILFADRPDTEAVAIDAYLKSLKPVPSPYLVDHRLSDSARRGKRLFEGRRAGCHHCHPAPAYSDLKSHLMRQPTRGDKLLDTPTLVEVWRTAPYLYDGRYTTIRELLIDGRHGLEHRDLSQGEINDLVDFVKSL